MTPLQEEGKAKMLANVQEGERVSLELLEHVDLYAMASQNNPQACDALRQKMHALLDKQLDAVDGIFSIATAHNLPLPKRIL